MARNMYYMFPCCFSCAKKCMSLFLISYSSKNMVLNFLREKNTCSFMFFIIAIAYTYFFGASLFLLRSRVENSTHIGAVHSVSTSGRRLSRTSSIYVFLLRFSNWNGGWTWHIVVWRNCGIQQKTGIGFQSGLMHIKSETKIYNKQITL